MTNQTESPTLRIHPEVSILVECDNATLKGRARAAESLEALASELAGPPAPFEVLLGVPGGGVPHWIPELVRSTGLAGCVDGAHVRIIPVGDLGYHAIKHALAREARGRILVFVDIDVIVQPGWLTALLAPFDDPGVSGTFGYTTIGPIGSAYDQAMSATWVFDPRRPEEGGPEHPFRSNNVAFRASVYANHPFRATAGEHRSAGKRLHHELLAAGRRLERVSATTLHPPLALPVDFVLGPLLSGRDRAMNGAVRSHGPSAANPSLGRRRLATLRARAQAAGVRPVELPLVLAVGGTIRLLQVVGLLIGRTRPQLLDRWA